MCEGMYMVPGIFPKQSIIRVFAQVEMELTMLDRNRN
jgi:hypothetical protein